MLILSRLIRPWTLASSLILTIHTVISFQVRPSYPVANLKSRVQGEDKLLPKDVYDRKLQFSTYEPTVRTKIPFPLLGPYRRRSTRQWSSDPNNTPDSDEEARKKAEDSYDGLYEFLTRRTGEQAGETERRRKRDRIRDWMTSSSGGNSGGGSSKIRPIRMEDGSVMEESELPRTQARFERLFSGMPTLNEILSNEAPPSSGAEDEFASARETTERKQTSIPDDSWFDEEKAKIENEYAEILQQMKTKIYQQRQEDPESVPSNAEGVAESVVQQELQRMLVSVKSARAKERLQDYEINRKSALDSRDLTGATDEVVENILKEAADDWKRQEALQDQVDDFNRYEEAARDMAAFSLNEISRNMQPGKDLDTWALERLENMLENMQQKATEESAAVSDILEQQIDDLRERMEKESQKGSIRPQTMKEWQMYRAIATRLGKDRMVDATIGRNSEEILAEEEQVAKLLNSWREYIGKEEEIRKRSGLSLGPKMPFDWQRAERNPEEDEIFVPRTENDAVPKSRRELRRDVNLQAIRALEDLVQKSDSVRAEGLQKQLDALRAELEPRDYHDVEEEAVEETMSGPIDLSDVFRRSDEFEEEIGSTLPSNLYQQEQDRIDQILSSNEDISFFQSKEQIPAAAPPLPNTPFFSDTLDGETRPPPPNTPFFVDSLEEENKAPPPNTPFFSDADRLQSDEIDVENTKLGTADDQKLLNMYRKAGARTKEEQDSIREEWEAFQALEKIKRDKSGLSDEDDASLMDQVDMKYDLTEVMKGDGDIDAEKILSTIGPRPSRRKAPTSSESEAQPVSDENARRSSLDPAEVSESLYRSVSAVGGGRTKDNPEARAEQKSEFEEYMKKEDELRRSLDDLDSNAESLAAKSNIGLDDASYAQDALKAIGPRPIFKKKRKQVIDEKELSDRGGVRAAGDSDESVDIEEDFDEDDLLSSSVDLIPDWLKKERKAMQRKEGGGNPRSGFSGGNIDEVFDDDQYDHNLRQLHEYEQRRSGRQKQMGIDISDVLGNRARGSDDYADYSYDTDYFRGRQEGWGAVNFDARKAGLLEYVELSVPELNNLMDHRDSVYSTGVSQYLPRINKPFKEFGAIFRLEGVLMDLTGINQQVWTNVANEFGFKLPIQEEVQRASVVPPEVAIREIFFWSTDMFVVREASSAFRRVLRELLNEWASENGLREEMPSAGNGEKGFMALGAEVVSEVKEPKPLSAPSITFEGPRFETEQSRLKRLQEAWIRTSQELELPEPSNQQIAQSSFLDPEITVREIFRWTSQRNEIDAVVSVFRAVLDGKSETGSQELVSSPVTSETSTGEGKILEYQYEAWKKVADEESYTPPSPEEVLAAAVLNDPIAVIISGFGWTNDPSLARTLASKYEKFLAGYLVAQGLERTEILSPQENPSTKEDPLHRRGPTEEEVLATQIQAWREAAQVYFFDPPSSEQIQITMNFSAEDAVRRLLGWAYNFNEEQIAEITKTYANALARASEKYMAAYGLSTTKEVPSPMVKSDGKQLTSDQLFKAAFDAWTHVAWTSGYTMPDAEQVQFAMTVGPEEAIIHGFQWTESDATLIADRYRDQINLQRMKWQNEGYLLSSSSSANQEKNEQPLVVVRSGVAEWIKSLKDVEMGCGVTSYLEADQVNMLLEYARLGELLPNDTRVSMSNGYERDSQQMLGVALRIERRPDHCVVFDSCPAANRAAHEVEMRSVSLVGPYPRYELLSSDASAVSFDELTAMNIRRLFGERIYDQPMLDSKQFQPEVTRKTKTAFWDDE